MVAGNGLDFKSVWTKWVPFALEPHNSGRVYGGSSGSSWGYVTNFNSASLEYAISIMLLTHPF